MRAVPARDDMHVHFSRAFGVTSGQVRRDGETRTPDPLLPKQVRYQLRHIPDPGNAIGRGRRRP